MKKYRQGTYEPQHPEKYRGSLPCIYRSSLEMKLMQWLDANSNILSWGSESVVLPYISPKDGKCHKYFVDFVFSIKKGNEIKKYLVEVKPSKQCNPPTRRKNTKSFLYENMQYAVNQQKWKSATEWAEKNGYKFIIFTEKHLK